MKLSLFCPYCLLLAIALLCIPTTRGQEVQPGFGVETNMLAGKIFRQDTKFTGPIPSLSAASDMNFIWQTCGKKEWHQRRRFPMIGVGLTYTNYGLNNVYGQCLGLYTNIQIPLIRRQKFEWTLRIGDGVGYVTKKFQTVAPVDTLNNAISTHLNDFAIFMTDVRYHVNEHWDVQWGLNFTHISNADFHDPNLGVNMVGTHIGVRYFPNTSRPARVIRDLTKLSNRWLTEGRFGIAWNEARAKGNPELPTYVGSLYESRRWMSKNKVFVGTDYAYHESTYAFLRNYGVDYGHEKENSWQGAFFAGNEFLLGRVGIMMQIGVYYKQTFLKQDPYYEKLGGNLYLVKREKGTLKELFVSVLLKTHKIVAEFAEFGLGMGF